MIYKWGNFQVLAQRHKQEQEELMNRFDEEKEEVVNKALSALENRLLSWIKLHKILKSW